jgi:hypothetical protein
MLRTLVAFGVLLAAVSHCRGQELCLPELAVGRSFNPRALGAVVLQVTAKDTVHVAMQQSTDGGKTGRPIRLELRRVTTEGKTVSLKEGRVIAGRQLWDAIIGQGNILKVTGTTQHTTELNQKRTIYVLEPVKDGPKPGEAPPGLPSVKEAKEATEKARQEFVAGKQREKEAQQPAAYLAYAKKLIDREEYDKARERLREIIDKYPSTKEATEAKELLEKIGPPPGKERK